MNDEKPSPGWKERIKKQGRWVDQKPKDAIEAQSMAVISIKARRAEIEEFKATCASLGLKPNRALRSMMRESVGYLEARPGELDELRSISKQIRGIATNINQIAKALNERGSYDAREFKGERMALGREIGRLDAKLQRTLDVGKRRHDGIERLVKITRELDSIDAAASAK